MSSNYAEINAVLPWFFPVVAAVFGALIGSFLNVVIYRVPAGKSIVRPGSHCACGQPIAWYDNIPILSWFILRGRARCCGRPYSFRYPFIEFLTAALFLACWFRFAEISPGKAVCGMLFVSILICATFIDLDHMIIPDVFTIWFGLIGVALSVAVPALHGQMTGDFSVDSVQSLIVSTKGLFIGSALVLWIAFLAEHILRKEAMGFGDVKFVGMIGAFCGWQGAVCSIFGGAMVGTLWFILALVWQKISGRPQGAPREQPAQAIEEELAEEAPSSPKFNYINAAALGAGVLGVIAAFFNPAFFPATEAPFILESLESVVTALTGLLLGSGAVLCVGLVIETPLKKDWLPPQAVTFAGAVGAFSRWHEGWLALLWGALFAAIATGGIFVVLKAIAKLRQKPAITSPVPAPIELPATTEADDQPVALGFGMHVPFGPMLAIGALIYFLGGDQWIAAYFAQFTAAL